MTEKECMQILGKDFPLHLRIGIFFCSFIAIFFPGFIWLAAFKAVRNVLQEKGVKEEIENILRAAAAKEEGVA
jgi:hypothetical protein